MLQPLQRLPAAAAVRRFQGNFVLQGRGEACSPLLTPRMSLLNISLAKFSFPSLLVSLQSALGIKKKSSGPATAETVLACDFGKAKIVFLETEKNPQGILIKKFLKIPRDPVPGKDSESLKEAFSKGGFSTKKVRVSLKGQGVIIRFIQFPQMKPEDLKSAITFEIDQYIPFKADEVIWDFFIIDDKVDVGGKIMMNILLVAVKRQEIYSMLEIFNAAELQIALMDVDALASINAVEQFHPEDFKLPIAILDIGSEISTLAVVQGAKPRFIRDITYGGVDIIKKIRRKLNFSQEQALEQIEADRVPSTEAVEEIKEALGDLATELKATLNYYYDQVPGSEPIQKIFIEGGGGYHPLVIEKLTQDMGCGVERIHVLDKVQLAEGLDANHLKSNQGILSIPIGLCLREL